MPASLICASAARSDQTMAALRRAGLVMWRGKGQRPIGDNGPEARRHRLEIRRIAALAAGARRHHRQRRTDTAQFFPADRRAMIGQDDIAARHRDVVDELRAMALVGLRRNTKGKCQRIGIVPRDLGDLLVGQAVAQRLIIFVARLNVDEPYGATMLWIGILAPAGVRIEHLLEDQNMTRLEIRVKIFERRMGRALG